MGGFVMATYLANRDETIVHVCAPTGCGEYTMCGLEMSELKEDD